MMIEKKAKGKGKAIIGIVMAVIMLASLVAIAPTSEARPTANQIDSGDTVYIGEQGLALDLNGDGIYGDVGVLEGVPDTPTEGEPPLSVSTSWTVPDVTEGKYYYDANANGALDAGEFYIYIDHAEITGDVILNTPTQDSIVGKSVPPSAEIVFKAELNFGGGKIPGAELKIMLTDPDGVDILAVDGQSLRNIDALGTTMFVMGWAGDPDPDDPSTPLVDEGCDGISTTTPHYVDALDLTDMDAGTYTVKIKTEKEDCNLLDISSAEMEFTIRSEELSIEALKDTVYRGEDIILKVTGNPMAYYYLIVTNVDVTAPPEIKDAGDVKALDTTGAAYPATGTPNLAAWIKTGSDGIADVKIDTTGADNRIYTIKVYYQPEDSTGPLIPGIDFVPDEEIVMCKDDDDVDVEVVELVPQVSVFTDKKEYSPGDVMKANIRMTNPADDTQTLLFEWYLGIPEYDLWAEMKAMPVNLPPGYDQTLTVSIPVGDWGAKSFCGCHIVSLTDTKNKKVVSVDSTTWIYMPSVLPESKTSVEIAKEITKEIEGVELQLPS